MSPSVEVLIGAELDELLRSVRRDAAPMEARGYVLVGGVRYTTRGFSGKTVLMVGPERDRIGSVMRPAGTAIVISSVSADSRRLVSRNSGFFDRPLWEICNDFPGADPTRLDEAHSDALGLVREVFSPLLRTEGETIEEMADALGEYLKLIEGVRLFERGSFGALGDDSRSAKRIEGWRSAEPPTLGMAL